MKLALVAGGRPELVADSV
jgi:hypothetical protein